MLFRSDRALRGTLMHHFQQEPLAILALPVGVAAPAVLGRLVLQPGEPLLEAPRFLRARLAAVDLASIARAAIRELRFAATTLLNTQQLHQAAAPSRGLDIVRRTMRLTECSLDSERRRDSTRRPGALPPGRRLFGALPPLTYAGGDRQIKSRTACGGGGGDAFGFARWTAQTLPTGKPPPHSPRPPPKIGRASCRERV